MSNNQTTNQPNNPTNEQLHDPARTSSHSTNHHNHIPIQKIVLFDHTCGSIYHILTSQGGNTIELQEVQRVGNKDQHREAECSHQQERQQ